MRKETLFAFRQRCVQVYANKGMDAAELVNIELMVTFKTSAHQIKVRVDMTRQFEIENDGAYGDGFWVVKEGYGGLPTIIDLSEVAVIDLMSDIVDIRRMK